MTMKPLLMILAISCTLVSHGLAADAKPTWQANWEKTLAAAKKEGKLNFYVGRYGTEPLLDEFRKEFPEIRLVTVNGTGNSLGTRILAESRAGKALADLFSGGANTNYEVLYAGKALDSIKSLLILPEFIKRLFGDMQPTFGRDRRQITDWLAQGKYALCVGCRESTKARNQGLPVDELDNVEWREGLELSTGGG